MELNILLYMNFMYVYTYYIITKMNYKSRNYFIYTVTCRPNLAGVVNCIYDSLILWFCTYHTVTIIKLQMCILIRYIMKFDVTGLCIWCDKHQIDMMFKFWLYNIFSDIMSNSPSDHIYYSSSLTFYIIIILPLP